MSTLSLRLPDSLHQRLKAIAQKDGVSINQFISSAVAEKMSALMTEEYLVKRASKGSKNKFLKAMAKVPDIEPDANDKKS